jgi:hypothetical protein
MESAHEDSILELLKEDSIVEVILINCVFIQTNETTLRGHEFIYISEMVFRNQRWF